MGRSNSSPYHKHHWLFLVASSLFIIVFILLLLPLVFSFSPFGPSCTFPEQRMMRLQACAEHNADEAMGPQQEKIGDALETDSGRRLLDGESTNMVVLFVAGFLTKYAASALTSGKALWAIAV